MGLIITLLVIGNVFVSQFRRRSERRSSDIQATVSRRGYKSNKVSLGERQREREKVTNTGTNYRAKRSRSVLDIVKKGSDIHPSLCSMTKYSLDSASGLCMLTICSFDTCARVRLFFLTRTLIGHFFQWLKKKKVHKTTMKNNFFFEKVKGREIHQSDGWRHWLNTATG